MGEGTATASTRQSVCARADHVSPRDARDNKRDDEDNGVDVSLPQAPSPSSEFSDVGSDGWTW